MTDFKKLLFFFRCEQGCLVDHANFYPDSAFDGFRLFFDRRAGEGKPPAMTG